MEAAVHLPRPAIVPTDTALTITTLPALITICETDRIVIDVASRRNKHQWQGTVNVDALTAGSIIIVNSANDFMLVILQRDGKAVVGCANAIIRR